MAEKEKQEIYLESRRQNIFLDSNISNQEQMSLISSYLNIKNAGNGVNEVTVEEYFISFLNVKSRTGNNFV